MKIDGSPIRDGSAFFVAEAGVNHNGDHVLVDSAVAVSHDAKLGDGATIAPNATLAGGVSVGRDAFVGAGATVRDHVEIGDGAAVGAGAVIVEDVPPETTVVGVPAEPME